MKIGKKVLIFLFFMLVAMCFVNTSTVNAATTTVTANNYTKLKQYLEEDIGADEYIINVTGNITVTSTINVVGKKTVKGAYTLTNGVTVASGKSNAIFYVDEGVTLSLDGGIKLDGKNKSTIASSNVVVDGTLNIKNAELHKGTQGVYVSNKGKLTMSGGTIAADNENIGIANYGTTTLSGGTIKCPRIGVYVNGGTSGTGSFTMSGGSIIDYDTKAPITSAQKLGGIVSVTNGTVTVSGGTIKKSKVTESVTVNGELIDYEVTKNGYAIYHDGKACSITGGTFGENQIVYLNKTSGFIDIKASKPTFKVEPATYTRGRKMIQTSSAISASKADELRENITVQAPKGEDYWSLKESGNDLKLWEYNTIIVNYVYNDEFDKDDSGNPKVKNVASPTVINKWAGEAYTTTPVNKTNFVLKTTPSNASGTVSGSDITVTYVYNKNKANITVRYVDTNGNSLGSDVVTGYVGEDYVATPKEIAGYKPISTTSVTKVYGTDTELTWTYIKQTKVTVKYIDKTTNNSIDQYNDVVKEYSYGDVYEQFKNETIDGYVYLNTTITGTDTTTVGNDDIVITHYYSPSTKVIVKFLDKNNKNFEVAKQLVIDGYIGKDYTTTAINVDGYTYKGTTDDHTNNTNGQMTASTIVVEYYYIKKINITIRYVDLATTRDIVGQDPVSTLYDEGDTIDLKQKDISGYTYSRTEPTMTVVGNTDATIIHYYNASTSLTVRHLDKFDNSIEIETAETSAGYLGKDYTTRPLTTLPSNYVYRGDNSGNTSGKMGSGATVVDYYYVKRVPVTIKYIDQTTGNEISGYSTTTTIYDQGTEYDGKYVGNIGAYTYLSTTIEGTDGNKVGPNDITVTHYYSTNTQVVVRHLDINNNSINVGQAQTISGYVGDTYTTAPLSGAKLPTNYMYKGNNSGNTSGTITGGSTVITYYYVKQVPVTVKYVNKYTGNVIKEEKEIYDQGSSLDKKEQTLEGYSYLETTVEGTNNNIVNADDVTVTHYYAKAATVLVRYIDKNDHTKVIHDPTIIDGAAGEPYTVQPLDRAPARYVYRGDNSGNISGTFTDDQIVVDLYYTRQSLVTVEYIDQNTNTPLNKVDNLCDEKSALDRKKEEITGYKYLKTEVVGTTNEVVGTEDIVVKHYYAKNANLVVKFVDKNNNSIEIGESQVIDGYEGKVYVTNKLENIPTNYVYRDENSGNTIGKMPAGTTEVYYYYIKRIPATIKYVDNTTMDVLDQRIDIYDETELLDKKEKEMPDYTYLNTEVTGCDGENVGPDDITVTHYYGRNTSVLVKHLDKNNNKIEVGEEVVIDGYEGKEYTTSILSQLPDNYVYQNNNSGNITGTMKRNQLLVEYYYVKQVPVTVKYVDINTQEVLEETTDIYDETSVFDKKQKDISEYTYQKTEITGTTNDTVGPDDIVVTHYYAKNTSVLVKYLDQNNHEIEVGPSVTIDGYEGKEYTTEKLATVPSGYVDKDQNSGNTSGVMTRDQLVVEYYYVKQVPVTVKYVDKNSGRVLEEVTDIYEETSTFDKKEKEFEGYEYSDTVVEGTDNEFVGPNNVVITHNYIKKSKLTVKYVDINNNQDIIDEIVSVYKEGDEFTVYAKDFGGYILEGDASYKTDVMGSEDMIITFYYKKISGGIVAKYVDGVTNDLLEQVIFEGKVGDSIIVPTKEFDNYVLVDEPSDKVVTMEDTYKEVVFVYYRRITLIVRGIDTYDNSVLWEYTLTGVEGQTYSTAYKVIDGYNLVNATDSKVGTFNRNESLIVYEYKKSTLKGDMNVDGFINSTDAALILDKFKNQNITAQDFERGDMNNDDLLNSTDAAMILDIFKNS